MSGDNKSDPEFLESSSDDYSPSGPHDRRRGGGYRRRRHRYTWLWIVLAILILLILIWAWRRHHQQ
jgi:hypothetical protein